MLKEQITDSSDVSSWTKETMARLQQTKPEFASKSEAIAAFTKELGEIAVRHSMPVERLLEEAGASSKNNADFDRALRLSSLIYAIKQTK